MTGRIQANGAHIQCLKRCKQIKKLEETPACHTSLRKSSLYIKEYHPERHREMGEDEKQSLRLRRGCRTPNRMDIAGHSTCDPICSPKTYHKRALLAHSGLSSGTKRRWVTMAVDKGAKSGPGHHAKEEQSTRHTYGVKVLEQDYLNLCTGSQTPSGQSWV